MIIVRKYLLGFLLATSVPIVGQAEGIVSTVTTGSDDIVVSSNAEATVTATGRADLISGNYAADFLVGTWEAKVTAGTIAYKASETVMSDVGTEGLSAISTNLSDATKKVRVKIGSAVLNDCVSNLVVVSGKTWRACPQGVSSVSGAFALYNTEFLSPGNYPIGIDVAAYAY